MLFQHSDRTASEVQTGSVGGKHGNFIRFLILEWWRKEKAPDPEAEIRDCRAQVDQLMRQQQVEKRRGMQAEPARGEVVSMRTARWRLMKKLKVRSWMSREEC